MKVWGKDHHHSDDPFRDAPFWAVELFVLMELTMAAIDDLKSAIADLATALNDNNAEIDLLLTKITATGTSDADVAAAVQSIRDLITSNTAEVAKAKAAAP